CWRPAVSCSRAAAMRSRVMRPYDAPISESELEMIELLFQQIVAGVATGTIYACIALAIVMIYQSIGHINFAQGELAMLSTFVAWQLVQWGMPYWSAFALTIPLSFLLGVALERALMSPIRNAQALSHIVVFIGLQVILNSAAGFIWDSNVKTFPSP